MRTRMLDRDHYQIMVHSLASKVESVLVECLQATGISSSELNEITFGFHESVWGSYDHSNRIIALNVALDHVPIRMLKSVIMHELCHVLVKGDHAVFNHMLNRADSNADEARAYFRKTTPESIIKG